MIKSSQGKCFKDLVNKENGEDSKDIFTIYRTRSEKYVMRQKKLSQLHKKIHSQKHKQNTYHRQTFY